MEPQKEGERSTSLSTQRGSAGTLRLATFSFLIYLMIEKLIRGHSMPNQSGSPSNETTPKSATGTRIIPILPVRDTVLFPHAVLPLTVGRESSIQLIESLGEERAIVVAAQLDARQDTPKPTDLHHV